MQYILNETEFQAFKALKEENAKLSHKLAVTRKTREMDRHQIEELGRARDFDNKKLAEQAHELLVKEAELAEFSSAVRKLNEQLLATQKAWEKQEKQIRELKRDCEGTSARLAATETISAIRLDTMNTLMQDVRRLKNEHVCIAQNPKTGTVKVISVVKADTYRKFGWTVSEKYLVDRPA